MSSGQSLLVGSATQTAQTGGILWARIAPETPTLAANNGPLDGLVCRPTAARLESLSLPYSSAAVCCCPRSPPSLPSAAAAPAASDARLPPTLQTTQHCFGTRQTALRSQSPCPESSRPPTEQPGIHPGQSRHPRLMVVLPASAFARPRCSLRHPRTPIQVAVPLRPQPPPPNIIIVTTTSTTTTTPHPQEPPPQPLRKTSRRRLRGYRAYRRRPWGYGRDSTLSCGPTETS